MSEPLLRVANRHVPACGDPPILNGDDPNLYIGYFENAHGEQWVFTSHRETRVAELRGGDIGWNEVHEVKNGRVQGVILSQSEAQWLQACWNAAIGPGA